MAITKEPFDTLLDWLDPDRDIAGERYEVIRTGLIRMFTSRGLSDAEYFADETFDRVTRRLPEIRADYVGDPARYVHGVARNIVMEAGRRKEIPTDKLPERPSQPSTTSDQYDCLLDCLKLLPPEKRELILDYHLFQGSAKIEHHHIMAVELSITEGALRTRAHHLRTYLEKCVHNCLDGLGRKQKDSQTA